MGFALMWALLALDARRRSHFHRSPSLAITRAKATSTAVVPIISALAFVKEHHGG